MNQEDISFFVKKILCLNPEDFDLNTKDVNDIVFPLKKYNIVGVFGKGTHGIILKVESNDTSKHIYACKIVKYRNTPEQTLSEFTIQKLFARDRMAPKIFLYDIQKVDIGNGEEGQNIVKFGRALMNYIHCTLKEYILKNPSDTEDLLLALQDLIEKKYLLRYPLPYLHSDMHIDNIVLLKDKKSLGFIDFGYTIRRPAALQILDCIPLITSMKLVLEKKGLPLDLCRGLVDFYNKMFRVHLDLPFFQKHPGGGYGYNCHGYMIHSYNWKATDLRNAPITDMKEIKTFYFPTLTLPKISNE